MKKSLILVLSLIEFLLISCDFGYDYNNPADKKSELYQGYETEEDVNHIIINQLTHDSTTLTWTEIVGATKYHLIVGKNPELSTLYYNNEDLTTNSVVISALDLNEGEIYYKVRAYKESWGDWSVVFSFTVDLEEPVNGSPYSSELITDTTPTLSWDEVTGATTYWVEVNTAEDFKGTEIVSDDTLTTNSYTLSIALDNNQNYYWRVKQKDATGIWSGWSDVFSFDLYSSDYAVGDVGPTGGYIFYADSSGDYDGWRYLEAAPVDISGTKVWGTFNFSVYGADGSAVGTGAQNTLDIIAGDAYSTNAAHACADYSVTVGDITYADWFLPSKGELDLMYDNLHVNGLGGFQSNYYWSSSEANDSFAWGQGFDIGPQGYDSKFHYGYVRPVRAF